MLRKLLVTSVLSFASVVFTYAQVGQGALKGKVIDKTTKEPLPFVNVVLEMNGNIVTGAASDFDGAFTIKPIPPGKYNVKATFTGYQPMEIKGLVVNAEKITFQDLAMSATSIDIKEFEVIEYTVPLISKDNVTTGATITKEDIDKLPGRNATAVAQTVGGVFSKDDGSGDLNIRGARSDANYYFIDGVKVRGSSTVPKASLEQVTVITGGVPASYGDVTGGIISVTTKGVSSEYGGSIDYSSSGYKLGNKMYGLDAYGFNLLEGSLYGPMIYKKDSTGKKTKPLLGFFISGNLNSEIDNKPSAIGWWKMKDDVVSDLNANPLRQLPGRPGTFLNSEFVRYNDLEKVKTRQNAAQNGFTLAGKIDVNTGNNTNLTFGGSMDYNKRHDFRYSNALMNTANNPEIIENSWRVYGRFTQRFGTGDAAKDEKSAATVKNAYYSIQMDYSHYSRTDWDDSFKDDLFKYGHIGQFTSYKTKFFAPQPSLVPGVGFAFPQLTYLDTLIAFTPGTVNPQGTQFTSSYYDLNGWPGGQVGANGVPVNYNFKKANPDAFTGPIVGFDEKFNPFFAGDLTGYFDNLQIMQQNGALRNGDVSKDIYGMWRTSAYQFNEYNRQKQSQFRVTATGSADIKDHAISVGFEFEQRTDRQYDLGNGSSQGPTDLWTLGRLYTNSHINGLDFSNPHIIRIGQVPLVWYDRLNASPGDYKGAGDPQYFFDYNLRQKLGLKTDGTDWVDFDSYAPSTFKINMFSADELNNFYIPNGTFTYYGYDHTGKKLKGNPSLDDFFTQKDELGNYTRSMGAFRPTYVAGYIQDKFAFNDLVFNIGLRIDRYDANQKVLKDPYVLFPSVKAGEDLKQYIPGLTDAYHKPSNIGDDYVVYVDDITNPTKVVGYRFTTPDKSKTTWYNAQGAELSDGSALRGASGAVSPLLVDKTRTKSLQVLSDGFEDYKPQTNFMPRIAFSFPISDEALFFAHYDVLTKRPTVTSGNGTPNSRLNPAEYYYLQQIDYTINNPNLKPEQTIDYEAGFQQKLNQTSSLKISAFYRELRNMVQVVNVVDAYPKNIYRTYGNIDFGTIKGMTISYDLRKTGNLRTRISYTLQFAEGTGSDATTGLNLAAQGKQNLRTNFPLNYDQRHAIVASVDYRYGQGSNYDGPVWFGKQIFANTGANFVFNAGSGTPYSGQRNYTGEAYLSRVGSPTLLGQVNGSRLPWQYRADARLDRNIELTWNIKGEGEEKTQKTANMNIYLQVLNVFNAKNIVDVYRATGNPNDDGFLGAAQYQKYIQQQNNEQSFRELYSAKINSPFNYNLPRRIRLGVLMTF